MAWKASHGERLTRLQNKRLTHCTRRGNGNKLARYLPPSRAENNLINVSVSIVLPCSICLFSLTAVVWFYQSCMYGHSWSICVKLGFSWTLLACTVVDFCFNVRENTLCFGRVTCWWRRQGRRNENIGWQRGRFLYREIYGNKVISLKSKQH